MVGLSRREALDRRGKRFGEIGQNATIVALSVPRELEELDLLDGILSRPLEELEAFFGISGGVVGCR